MSIPNSLLDGADKELTFLTAARAKTIKRHATQK